jgi:RNA polymerase sigma factor (TIGR02999 family)
MCDNNALACAIAFAARDEHTADVPSERSNLVPELMSLAASGDAVASEKLLPLVYDELRDLARRRLARERNQTLDPTGLVHEAYMRLVGDGSAVWSGKRHFMAAAGIAMRRILVERARRVNAAKHGGGRRRQPLSGVEPLASEAPEPDWVSLDAALTDLEAADPELAELVHLRYFAGLGIREIAEALGRAPRSVDRDWSVARAWLLHRIAERGVDPGEATSEPG